MGKWEHDYNDDVGVARIIEYMDDGSVRYIAFGLGFRDADRLVREHNAIPKLVEALKSFRNEIDANDNEMTISTTADWSAIVDRADAVLAQAEGRE